MRVQTSNTAVVEEWLRRTPSTGNAQMRCATSPYQASSVSSSLVSLALSPRAMQVGRRSPFEEAQEQTKTQHRVALQQAREKVSTVCTTVSPLFLILFLVFRLCSKDTTRNEQTRVCTTRRPSVVSQLKAIPSCPKTPKAALYSRAESHGNSTPEWRDGIDARSVCRPPRVPNRLRQGSAVSTKLAEERVRTANSQRRPTSMLSWTLFAKFLSMPRLHKLMDRPQGLAFNTSAYIADEMLSRRLQSL